MTKNLGLTPSKSSSVPQENAPLKGVLVALFPVVLVGIAFLFGKYYFGI